MGLEGGMGTVKGKADWGHEFFFKGLQNPLIIGLGKSSVVCAMIRARALRNSLAECEG